MDTTLFNAICRHHEPSMIIVRNLLTMVVNREDQRPFLQKMQEMGLVGEAIEHAFLRYEERDTTLFLMIQMGCLL